MFSWQLLKDFKSPNFSSILHLAEHRLWETKLLWDMQQTFGRTVCCGQNIVKPDVYLIRSEYCQRKCHFATFKILSHQMSIRCGQSFVKANFNLFPFYFFSARFPLLLTYKYWRQHLFTNSLACTCKAKYSSYLENQNEYATSL